MTCTPTLPAQAGPGRHCDQSQRDAHGAELAVQRPERGTTSPRSEEGQQHFAFLADEAEELLRLPGLLSRQVDLTHDDRPDRGVLDLGVGLGDGDRVYVEDDVLDRGRAFFQGTGPVALQAAISGSFGV